MYPFPLLILINLTLGDLLPNNLPSTNFITRDFHPNCQFFPSLSITYPTDILVFLLLFHFIIISESFAWSATFNSLGGRWNFYSKWYWISTYQLFLTGTKLINCVALINGDIVQSKLKTVTRTRNRRLTTLHQNTVLTEE